MAFTATVAMISAVFSIPTPLEDRGFRLSARGGTGEAPILHFTGLMHGVGDSCGHDVRRCNCVASLFVERHDDERLIIVGRTIARELADRSEQRLLDLVGVHVSAFEQRALEAFEAERLSVVVDRFDESVAIENEAIAGREFDCVLLEWIAALHAERKSPRRQRFELAARRAINIRIETEERRVGKECRSRWSPYH